MNKKTEQAVRQIDDNKMRSVMFLRDLADRLEKGEVLLYTISANAEPYYKTVQHSLLKPRRALIDSRSVRTLAITYREM